MDKMMKECMKTHPLLHTVVGIGIGYVLVALIPVIASNAMVFGIILIVASIAGEFMTMKK